MRPDIKGLVKLAGVIRRVNPKRFDMGHWWAETPCGTSGCIAGHASFIFPARFKRVGKDGDYEIMHTRSGETGSSAFAKGFRITEAQAEHITLGNLYRTPKIAAKEIMALVGKLRKEVKA